MASLTTIGHGTQFGIGVIPEPPGPISYVPLAEVITITGPSLVRDTVDVTHMASPEKWREFTPGLRDAGEITLTLNFIPGSTDEEAIFSLFASDVGQLYKITFPNSEGWEFVAFCTGYDTETPLDDKMTATVTFKLSGKPTFFVVSASAANLASPQPAAAPGPAVPASTPSAPEVEAAL